MKEKELEVNLAGEFTTIDIKFNDTEIPLEKIADGQYHYKNQSFNFDENIKLSIYLIGYPAMSWKLEIFIDGIKYFSNSDTFVKNYYRYP